MTTQEQLEAMLQGDTDVFMWLGQLAHHLKVGADRINAFDRGDRNHWEWYAHRNEYAREVHNPLVEIYKREFAKYNSRQQEIRNGGGSIESASSSAVSWIKDKVASFGSFFGIGVVPLLVPVVGWVASAAIAYFVTDYFTESKNSHAAVGATAAELSRIDPQTAKEYLQTVGELQETKGKNSLGFQLGQGLKIGLTVLSIAGGIAGGYWVYNQINNN